MKERKKSIQALKKILPSYLSDSMAIFSLFRLLDYRIHISMGYRIRTRSNHTEVLSPIIFNKDFGFFSIYYTNWTLVGVSIFIFIALSPFLCNPHSTQSIRIYGKTRK